MTLAMLFLQNLRIKSIARSEIFASNNVNVIKNKWRSDMVYKAGG